VSRVSKMDVVAPVVASVMPITEGRTTRAELSKAYPKIVTDFRKFEVSSS
jgi:hypothetical protein